MKKKLCQKNKIICIF